MQKLEKLIDVAAEALSLYIRKTTAELGEALPLKGAEDAQPAAKTRKPRTPKMQTVTDEDGPKSPFDIENKVAGDGRVTAAPVSKLTAEQAIEAGRRGQEVMGLFIRRNLKASPPGLEQTKAIINKTLGLPRVPATSWKLEDFTPEDWLKLTPLFEAELDKVGA